MPYGSNAKNRKQGTIETIDEVGNEKPLQHPQFCSKISSPASSFLLAFAKEYALKRISLYWNEVSLGEVYKSQWFDQPYQ